MIDERDEAEPALKWDMREQIIFPSREREKRLPIRRADWERMKRCAEEGATAQANWLLMVASALFGVAATAALSIPLARVQGMAPWVWPLYACVALFSLMTAIVLTLVDCRVRANERKWADSLKQDMVEIEDMFGGDAVEWGVIQFRHEKGEYADGQSMGHARRR